MYVMALLRYWQYMSQENGFNGIIEMLAKYVTGKGTHGIIVI